MIHTFSLFKTVIGKKLIRNDITLENSVRLIKSDKHRQEIEQLRNASDKNVYNVLKKNLSAFTFSGTFPSERVAEKILKHSGLICMDFDLNGIHPHPDFPRDATKKVTVNEINVENVKYRLSLDPYTCFLFTSPGGQGVKCIVKINPDNHANSFLSLEAYYLEKYGIMWTDTSGKDVSRACFISWDPYCFFNPEAPVFVASVIEDKKPHYLPAQEQVYKIDTDSGELIPISDEIDWTRDLKNQYDRAVQITKRIVEASLDTTGQYNDWLTIGFSLAIFGEKGRELFHLVSQFHPDYKQKDCDKKFDDYLKNGRFKTAAKFFAIAKEYSIDTRVTREVAAASAENAEGKEFQDWDHIYPKGVEGTKDTTHHVNKYGFFEYENRYYHALYDVKNRTITFDESSNYIIHPLFLSVSRAEPKRIIEIENVYNVRKLVEIPANAFVSLSEFNAFVEGQGNFLNDFDKKQFYKIKKKVYNETKNAYEIRTLGWHREGFYAFSNGVFTIGSKTETEESKIGFVPSDDYGVVDISGNYYFLPALSSIYKDEEDDFQTHKKFLYKKSKIKYDEWSTQFCAMHKDNGKIGLLYFMSALFRDIIYDRFKFFPHLFLFGPPGTGKSAMGISITSMFGEPLQPFLLTSGTPVAFHKRFAEFRNSVLWFDEYRNSMDPRRIQAFKGAYDGSAHEKSENTSANRTKSTPVNSGCVISGQELPIADNALFKRVILLQYHQTEFTEHERNERMKLIAMEKAGLSYITAHLTKFRHTIEEKYMPVFETTIKEFKELLDGQDGIEERIIQNMCILVAMQRTLSDVIKFPFTDKEFTAIAVENIRSQNNLILSSKETSTFWQLVEFMLDKKEIKQGEDFMIKPQSRILISSGREESRELIFPESKELLYLKLSKIHPLYMEYHRKQYNVSGMDIGSLKHYLNQAKAFIGHTNSVRFENTKTSALIFDYKLLKKEGINLDRGTDVNDSKDEPILPINKDDQPF